MNSRLKSQRGFTLVELSIVLVIIGLIIGGVLTGQQIILNARTTNAINAIQSYQSQFQTYAQNYGALPGDDANAGSRFPAGSVPSGTLGNGNGSIAGSFDAATTTESRLVWADLRAAGLVKGQSAGADVTAQAPNPFNGIYGFQDGAFAGGITGTAVCLNNVPAAAARAIDTQMDDGAGTSGTMQAMGQTGTALGAALTGTAADYGADSVFVVCMRI